MGGLILAEGRRCEHAHVVETRLEACSYINSLNKVNEG